MSSDFKSPARIRDPDLIRRFRLEHFNEPCDDCEMRLGVDPHHVEFRSQGGDDVAENLLWLCRICHDARHGVRAFLHD